MLNGVPITVEDFDPPLTAEQQRQLAAIEAVLERDLRPPVKRLPRGTWERLRRSVAKSCLWAVDADRPF